MSRNINPVPQFFDGSGDPVISGKMFYFDSGTTTQKTTFADSALTIANTHPVLLDGSGRLPNVFFNGTAKQILTTSGDIQVWERDPVGGDTGVTFGADWNPTQVYEIEAVVRGSDEAYYRSLINSNSNNDPTTSEASWELLQFGRVWNTNVTYSVEKSVYGSDGLLYKSLTSSNLGNNPTSDTVNWGSGASAQINFYIDSGAADVYVLAVAAGGSKPKSLVDGLPIEFIPSNTNTTASTVNVAGFGVKDLKDSSGSALIAEAVVSGELTLATFNLGADEFRLIPLLTKTTEIDLKSGRNNILLNGDGIIDQENITTPIDDDTYAWDQWVVLSDGDGVVTPSQELADVPTGSRSARKLTVAIANKKFGMLQIVEGVNCKQIIDDVASLSMQAKSSGIANLRIAIISWTGTEDVVTSDVVSAWNAAGTDPTLVANWTYENTPANLSMTASWADTFKAENVGIDTASTKQVAVFIWADDTDAAVSDTLLVTDSQLEKGSVATDFERRTIGEELDLCQRYYTEGDYSATAGVGNASIIASYLTHHSFPVTMRVIPTITGTNIQGTFSALNISTSSVELGRSNTVATRQNSGTYTASARL